MRDAQQAQRQEVPGMVPWDFAAGEMQIESRRFVWLPRYLPVVDRHGRWDGKTARWLWLRFATLRGTRFGWEAVVDDSQYRR